MFRRIVSPLRATLHWFQRHQVQIFTLRLALIAVVIAIVPELSAKLEFQREGIAAGQWWRFLTGHLVHWNFDHLLWDVVMFVALGLCVASHRALRATVVGSMVAISTAVWLWCPDIQSYRGLSGVDSGLFVVAMAMLAADARRRHDLPTIFCAGLAYTGFVAKLIYESITGHCLFVDDMAAGFTPLVLAHVVGACVGVIVALIYFGPFPLRTVAVAASRPRRLSMPLAD